MLYTQDMLREVHDKSERSHNTDTEPTSTNQMSEQMSLMPPDHGYKMGSQVPATQGTLKVMQWNCVA